MIAESRPSEAITQYRHKGEKRDVGRPKMKWRWEQVKGSEGEEQ